MGLGQQHEGGAPAYSTQTTRPRPPTIQNEARRPTGFDGVIGTSKKIRSRLCILLFRLACNGGSYQWHEIYGQDKRESAKAAA